MPKEERILAWHFARDDGTLGYGDGRKIVTGRILSVDCVPSCCNAGLHASTNILDALSYSAGTTLCRVEVWGNVAKQGDKLCGTHRKTIAKADATRMLHEFAIWCAEQALEKVKSPNPRSLKAIEVKRAWLDDKATDDELTAASAAAWAAAWAADGAAARAAASAAAWAAARAAASAAAWAAARDAASAAAWAAARAAASAAAWAAQTSHLTELANSLLGLKGKHRG